MNDPQLDREEIRAVVQDALVAINCAVEIHPEDLDVSSIMSLQRICRDVHPRLKELFLALADPDDPIITDD